MKKFILFSCTFLAILLSFCFSRCFATDGNMANSMRNMTNSTKNAVSAVGNSISNGATAAQGAIKNMTNSAAATTTTTNNGNYTAVRTGTETQIKYAGMTATGWTWFIMAILAVLLIALIWYYARQNSTSKNDNSNHE